MNCSMCGHQVRVYSADEGTQSYEPVNCDRYKRALFEIASRAAVGSGSSRIFQQIALDALETEVRCDGSALKTPLGGTRVFACNGCAACAPQM